MKRFSNILLVADAALEDSVALERAVTLAINNQASLTLIDIVEDVPADLRMAVTVVTPQELHDIVVAEKREQLEEAVKSVAKRGIEMQAQVLVGKPFLEIIRQVLRNKHDLVIKCAESKASLKDEFFGSTDMHLLRKCPCPVWIIKTSEHKHYRRIVAAVDQDPEDAQRESLNQPILELATSMALAESSELHIVHAWNFFGESFIRSPRMNYTESEVDAMVEEEENERRQWLQELLDQHGVTAGKDAIDYLKPKFHLLEGQARDVVPIKVRELNADLIVMGTVARTGIPGFLMGNTAESILNQIDCSVLAIKPSGFESPVTL
ncbi:MAG: universal stress protein, UspA [Gammaproteobacteria bacterium]|nr:MAG: universal stress protein, UspA [Gammaproteobacteria bacterium]